MLALHHLPGLFIAFTQTFGGVTSLFNSHWCISEYDLSERIASSPAAQTIMIVSGARTSTIGIALFVFHILRKYKEFDILLAILGAYVRLIDGYVAWIEGLPRKTAFRLTAGLLIAAWGGFGMHAMGRKGGSGQ